MPVFFDSDPTRVPHNGTTTHGASKPNHIHDASARCIRIGLMNNMGDEALKATERQYISLLNAASDGILVSLFFYTLPGIPRNSSIGGHLHNLYSNIDDLWNGHLDGLIVTGREPLAAKLSDEPYWDGFTKLLGWADENTHSTVWSCLAAHAAILHMDGIERVKREDKLFGILECGRVSNHALTASIHSRFQLPHSRWNGVSEASLTDCGYSVLTRGAEAGVDTFIRQQKKLFIFFQGHPEYEADTLLREYRRDVLRYLRGERPTYPAMPLNYFDHVTTKNLATLQGKALAAPNETTPLEITGALEKITIENTWHSSAAGVYRSWLEYLNSEKQARLRSRTLSLAADLEPVLIKSGGDHTNVAAAPPA